MCFILQENEFEIILIRLLFQIEYWALRPGRTNVFVCDLVSFIMQSHSNQVHM